MVYGTSDFFKPRKVDGNVAIHMNTIGLKETEDAIEKGFLAEQRRRSGKLRNGRDGIEDDSRNKFNKNVQPGEFSYSNIPLNDKPWQQLYWDYFSEYMPLGKGWICKCGKKYLLGYPPYRCDWCKKLSPIGELDKAGAFKR